MRNSYACWVAGVAVVVLGIVAGLCVFGRIPSQPPWQFSSPTAAVDTYKKNARAAHTVALLPHQQSIRAGNAQSGAVASALSNGSRTDAGVVGRPFELSASMKAELAKSDVFRPARERLEQMAREPRDNEWANLAESQIQDLITSDGMNIRNIECRTTICAIEVAPASEPFDVVIIGQQLTRLDLWGPEYLTFSRETDDDGNSVKVALFEIRRR
jgi:hypothetical protein